MVFVVGIFDFSGAFNQKQKIEQAPQEGAIIAGAQPMRDITSGTGAPAFLHPGVTSALNSRVVSGVLAKGTCMPPGTVAPPTSPNLKWKFPISGCPDDLVIVI